MGSNLAVKLLSLVLSTIPLASAHGMQFQPVSGSPTEMLIGGRGPIVPGDTERLTSALSTLVQIGQTPLALALDSGGGNVAEARQMVGVIQARRLPVVIPSNSQCASACFLLLAASPRRLAAPDALIGVHSASQNNTETDTSLAVTTLMARDAAELGVPPSIIGKMVQTVPGRVEWLDPNDLASMHVAIIDGDLMAALRQPARASAVAPRDAPSAVPVVQTIAASAATDGMEDRRAWNVWLAGLRDAYRDGVLFAQSHLLEPLPASCYGPNNLNRGDFTLGCLRARERLAPVLGKMRSNPDYATGWSLPVRADSPTDRVEHEYQGAYFCGRQVNHLTLRLFQGVAGSRRRALFAFGPQDRNPSLPLGSFIVEGFFDATVGTLALTPVAWVSRPPGYQLLGLNGRSDDGGKTYRGSVTDSQVCTRFSLKRVDQSTAAQ